MKQNSWQFLSLSKSTVSFSCYLEELHELLCKTNKISTIEQNIIFSFTHSNSIVINYRKESSYALLLFFLVDYNALYNFTKWLICLAKPFFPDSEIEL